MVIDKQNGTIDKIAGFICSPYASVKRIYPYLALFLEYKIRKVFK
jgi:hypothetical protein